MLQAGIALREIRDKKLYRQEFGSFEEYCRAKWHISRPAAYARIGLADTQQELSAVADKPELNDRQARALAGLTTEDKKRVWQESGKLADKTPLTHKHILKARAALGLATEEKRKKNADTQPGIAKPSAPPASSDTKKRCAEITSMLLDEFARWPKAERNTLYEALDNCLVEAHSKFCAGNAE